MNNDRDIKGVGMIRAEIGLKNRLKATFEIEQC
jgi:hypothetical protein